MGEVAVLPLNAARMTAGYKNPTYRHVMGFSHYGVDMADLKRVNDDVYAPFKMEIVQAGYDHLLGGTIIAVSVNKVVVHNGPKKGERRLVIRMAHLKKTYVEAGDVIGPEDHKIAEYGGTGLYGGSPHLHVEIDSDTKWPAYSPTIKANSNIWRAGNDTTINPMDVFSVDVEGKRGFKQTLHYSVKSGDWLKPDDKMTLTMDRKVYRAKAY